MKTELSTPCIELPTSGAMRRFLRPFLFVAAVAALGAPASLVAQATDAGGPGEQEAVAAAESWLAIIDAGDYEQSWAETGSAFQNALSASDWSQRAGAVGGQLGGRRGDRAFVSTETMTDPPGAPAGDYVAVIYSSSFDMLDPAREVVTLVLEEGVWKVVGYVIVPE